MDRRNSSDAIDEVKASISTVFKSLHDQLDQREKALHEELDHLKTIDQSKTREYEVQVNRVKDQLTGEMSRLESLVKCKNWIQLLKDYKQFCTTTEQMTNDLNKMVKPPDYKCHVMGIGQLQKKLEDCLNELKIEETIGKILALG